MDVTQSLYARKSIRAYKPEQIDRKLLTEILEAAARTPSWGNSQPWEVFVADGAVLDRIREAYRENYENKTPGKPDIARPTEWTEDAKRRLKEVNANMLRDCGDAVSQFGKLNQCIFNAPAVIYLCVDRLLSHWALYDLGAYGHSVMLLAAERGLSTIPAITSVTFPQVLRRELKIPENLSIAIGIAIGYADEENAINNLNSPRDPVSSVVRFCE